MVDTYLEFEKPIVELEKKVSELHGLAVAKKLDVSEEILKLERRIEELKKEIYYNLNNWQKVLLSRHPNRPYTMDYIKRVTTKFIEFHGDRLFRDDPAIVGGIAEIEGNQVVILGHQKGRDTKEKLKRNFGMPHPEGYRKALRLMELASRFNKPIICFIDTPGAYPGDKAEERGQAEAIARNIKQMALFPVPIIVVIIGEGGSGGALAIAIGDKILMLEHAIYSVISPEGCASILWRDSDKASMAAESLKLSSENLLKLGIIDKIISEPLGGAHRNHDEVAERVKSEIIVSLKELKSLTVDELLERRKEKYYKIGVFNQN